VVPVVAIVGRPNVGKSTLFNALTGTRDALVVDLPGTTRDRQYGAGRIGEKPYIVIDTGGVGGTDQIVDDDVTKQSWQAIAEADIVLFLVDGQSGVTASDQSFARQLRKVTKPIHLVVNKIDGLDVQLALSDFFSLGFGDPVPIAANQKRGLTKLTDQILVDFELNPETDMVDPDRYPGIRVAIVGQPNVGKSTLVNRILGEERVIVSELSGTTRDSIFIPFEREGQQYTLIDTAGVRRKARIDNTVEKFSVVKTLQAIEASNVVVLMIDATRGVADQDLSLLDFIIEAGRALVIVINKWDGLSIEQREDVKKSLGFRLHFADFAIQHFISALHGSGVGNIFTSIKRAYKSAMMDLPTPELTKLLEEIVTAHQPPLVHGRRIKLRYAHSGGHNPPRIIIHGNQTAHVPDSYKRYMIKAFIDRLKLQGTPVVIQFKTGENPYAGKRNVLTPRQQYKRDRMMKHIRKSKK
jgi:GTP-binding protein